jgi:hypothetical protein
VRVGEGEVHQERGRDHMARQADRERGKHEQLRGRVSRRTGLLLDLRPRPAHTKQPAPAHTATAATPVAENTDEPDMADVKAWMEQAAWAWRPPQRQLLRRSIHSIHETGVIHSWATPCSLVNKLVFTTSHGHLFI